VALTIRARLTLWYSLVVLATLLATAIVLSVLHQRLGLSRIDAELDGNVVTVSNWVDHEFEEGLDPRSHMAPALVELELPGVGVSIVGADGRALGTGATGVGTPSSAALAAATEQPATVATPSGAVRIRSGAHTFGQYTLRLVVWTSLDAFSGERATLHRTLWLAMPAALLFAAAGGWLIGWRALAPLSTMARDVNAIDDRRLDSRLVVPSTGDELSALAGAFNGLLERLNVAFQGQRRFMADASHQLRTPLSIARVAAQVTLAQPERTTAEYRESLGTVAQQTERMTRMVDDMFELALADLDARPLQLEEVYLDEIVHECVGSARVLAHERNVTVTERTPTDVQLRADASLLRQMILNLVENAVRHTPCGGSVNVAMGVADGAVRIDVSDTGPGIPEADRERVFERFVRLTPAGSTGGGGLGLPIARWVAQLHGGTLGLESTGQGGSCFVARLPLR
jgi:heavy metal sensor kinase